MFFRLKPSGPRTYLQIVENRREDGSHRQHVLATLGRADDLAASRALAALLASGARLCDQVMLLSALERNAEGLRLSTRRIGGPLLFERLWEQTGCRAVIEELLAGRGFEFAVERAIFATVLHRLFVSGSDRACDKWIADYAIPGVDGLALHHLYRAMAWLGEELDAAEGGQAHATLFAPRCEGSDRGGAVRPPARPVQRALRRVHGHHLAQLRGRGRGGAGAAGSLEGSPARPDAAGPLPGHRL